MKIFRLFGVLAALLSAPAMAQGGPDASGNYIQNGSFESYSGSQGEVIPGWTVIHCFPTCVPTAIYPNYQVGPIVSTRDHYLPLHQSGTSQYLGPVPITGRTGSSVLRLSYGQYYTASAVSQVVTGLTPGGRYVVKLNHRTVHHENFAFAGTQSSVAVSVMEIPGSIQVCGGYSCTTQATPTLTIGSWMGAAVVNSVEYANHGASMMARTSAEFVATASQHTIRLSVVESSTHGNGSPGVIIDDVRLEWVGGTPPTVVVLPPGTTVPPVTDPPVSQPTTSLNLNNSSGAGGTGGMFRNSATSARSLMYQPSLSNSSAGIGDSSNIRPTD